MNEIIKIAVRPIYYIVLRIIKGGRNAFGYDHIGLDSVICHPFRVVGKKHISIGNRCYIMEGLRIEAVENWGGI